MLIACFWGNNVLSVGVVQVFGDGDELAVLWVCWLNSGCAIIDIFNRWGNGWLPVQHWLGNFQLREVRCSPWDYTR